MSDPALSRVAGPSLLDDSFAGNLLYDMLNIRNNPSPTSSTSSSVMDIPSILNPPARISPRQQNRASSPVTASNPRMSNPVSITKNVTPDQSVSPTSHDMSPQVNPNKDLDYVRCGQGGRVRKPMPFLETPLAFQLYPSSPTNGTVQQQVLPETSLSTNYTRKVRLHNRRNSRRHPSSPVAKRPSAKRQDNSRETQYKGNTSTASSPNQSNSERSHSKSSPSEIEECVLNQLIATTRAKTFVVRPRGDTQVVVISSDTDSEVIVISSDPTHDNEDLTSEDDIVRQHSNNQTSPVELEEPVRNANKKNFNLHRKKKGQTRSFVPSRVVKKERSRQQIKVGFEEYRQRAKIQQGERDRPTRRRRPWSKEMEDILQTYVINKGSRWIAISKFDASTEGAGLFKDFTAHNLADKARNMAVTMIKSGLTVPAQFAELISYNSAAGKKLSSEGYSW